MLYSIPWYVALFQSVPETFLIIKLGFMLFNIDIDIRKSLIISFGSGIFSYVIRKIITLFGLHTILAIILMVILVKFLTKIKWLHSFIGVSMGLLVAGVLQSTLVLFLLKVSNRNVNDLIVNPWLNVLYFLPCGLIMLGVYLIVKKKSFYLADLNAYTRIDKIV